MITQKKLREASDRIKVARVIADMLEVENAENMTPDAAINTGLRKIKNKKLTTDMLKTLTRMLKLAQDVGVKVDSSLIPSQIKEQYLDEKTGYIRIYDPDRVEDEEDEEDEDGVSQIKGHEVSQQQGDPSNKVGKSKHKVSDDKEDREDHIRRMKVRYHTEQALDYNTQRQTEKTATATKKAQLILRHAKERQALAARHHSQKQMLSKEETEMFTLRQLRERTCKKQLQREDDSDIDVLHLSDDELENMVSSIDFDDIVDACEHDDELCYVDDEGEIVDVEDEEDDQLKEVLSRAERMKARIRFLRTLPQRKRRMAIAMRRRSDAKTVARKARRMAINMVKKRLSRKSPSEMSVADKERIERILKTRKPLIDRLALKLIPRIREIESERIARSSKSE